MFLETRNEYFGTHGDIKEVPIKDSKSYRFEKSIEMTDSDSTVRFVFLYSYFLFIWKFLYSGFELRGSKVSLYSELKIFRLE